MIEVYRLHFCEVHGAEAKAGALEELYHDAANFLKRLDNPHVPDQNPAALHALRDAVARLRAAEMDASERGEALKRSYPPIPERVLEDTLDFNYDNPRRSETPVDWHYQTRFLLHKLMRLAYEKGETWLVETLEQHREHKSAQLAAALVHHA